MAVVSRWRSCSRQPYWYLKGIVASDLWGDDDSGREAVPITRANVARFEQTLVELSSGNPKNSDVHPLIAKAQEDAVSGQLTDLGSKLREY